MSHKDFETAQQAWADSIEANKKRYLPQPYSLAPWEELIHFDLPKVTVFVIPPGVNGASLLLAESRRVGCIFSCVTAGPAFISPVFEQTTGNGIQITAGTLPFSLTQSDWGGLVQSAWYGNSSAGATLYMVEILLHSWSDES